MDFTQGKTSSIDSPPNEEIVISDSTRTFRKHERNDGRGVFWRMPTSFGPMPGPRQDFDGRPRDGSKATFKTASLKFKSDATVLQRLLPTEKFRFASPDTVFATFAVTQLHNLEWLGGRGYSHFGLYIHGVNYTTDSGKMTTGTYLPILFENLADPIVSGREELGFPKLFADLDAHQEEATWSLNASWMGSKFGTMTLSNLVEPLANDVVAAPHGQTPAPVDEGLFVHKYIPATGREQRGLSDVEYTAFISNAEDAKTVEKTVTKTRWAKDARIDFDALDWKALPTLHHIIARLQEIPVYEVVDARIMEGTGVSDVSCVMRVQ